jgi:hypothetical protein
VSKYAKSAVLDMPKKSACWFTIKAIESLLEHHDFSAELPLKLLMLLNKIDAIEGNHLLHSLVSTPDQAPTNKKAFDDWSVCT